MKLRVQGCKCQGKEVIFRQKCCNSDDLKRDEYLEEEDDDSNDNNTALLPYFLATRSNWQNLNKVELFVCKQNFCLI